MRGAFACQEATSGARNTVPMPVPASEADRKRVVGTLRVHHAEGRLDDDEFTRLLERTYDARTRGQLMGSLRGLPGGRVARVVRRIQRALLGLHLAGYTTLNACVIGIWALTGKGTFWPAWLLLPTTFLLGWHVAGNVMLTRALRRRGLRPRRAAPL
jgi:hypothetical protein